MEDKDKLLIEAKEFFELNKGVFGEKIKENILALDVDFEDIAEHNIDLSEKLLNAPEETIRLLEMVVRNIEWIDKSLKVRIHNIPNTSMVEIRNIRSKHIGNFIKIKGTVKKASVVRPKTTNIKFECSSCGTIISILQMEKKIRGPNRCSCGNRGSFKELSKDLIDFQGLVIEELPEDIQGSHPHKIKVYITEDLVDPSNFNKTIPGTEVEICGVLKEVPIINAMGTSTEFDLAIEGNSLVSLEEEEEEVLTEEEEREIKELSKSPNILEKITNSIAPSICGHHNVKAALAFQLFGGVKSIKKDGTTRRGDIHCLLVGDPGVSKSVILNFGHKITPKSRFISGKSTSAAGIIAGVTKDELSGGWSVEAGAMVLASGSILFGDEFEKMSEEDRSSMHQAMEQQEVNISKVSIQAKLKTQTAVFAAANPKYGRFKDEISIDKQINMAPSLLSRFDMIIVMKDIPHEERDGDIADKILDIDEEELVEVIEQNLLKKYITYARKHFSPKMLPVSAKRIKEYYIKMRKINGRKSGSAVAIGTRQLEGMVRLAQAHAKMRLSKTVDEIDSIKAIKTMNSYLRKMGFDDETREFDVDMLTGPPASKISLLNKIHKTIIDASKKGVSITYGDLLKVLNNLTEDELYPLVDQLKKNGTIYEIKRGHFRTL